MSLVNLAHVCSHLQNASLARLGLTSIPYTKLHLSLSLLLHKQGFLSQVKLGGPSPPASCFPPGMRDNKLFSSHPHHHGEGSMHSPESALQRVVNGPGLVSAEQLREEGFADEAISFAMEERYKDTAQLEREGWAEVAADFLLMHADKPPSQLRDDGLDDTAISVLQQHAPLLALARAQAQKWYGPLLTSARAEVDKWPRDREADGETRAAAAAASVELRRVTALTQSKLREYLLREGFPVGTLRYFAGPTHALRSERDLARDGLTLHAMGLAVPNQPFHPPPPPTRQDPWQLEAEGVVTQANRASRRLWLGLKYWEGMPVLRKASMLSKPTKRIWIDARECGRLVRGNAVAKGEVKGLTQVGECIFLTTDAGVMEVRDCAERKVGGMVLCRVW